MSSYDDPELADEYHRRDEEALDWYLREREDDTRPRTFDQGALMAQNVQGPTGDDLEQALTAANITPPEGATADEKRQLLLDAAATPAAQLAASLLPPAAEVPEELSPAEEQRRADLKARADAPNAVVAREANPAIGGESFGYGKPA